MDDAMEIKNDFMKTFKDYGLDMITPTDEESGNYERKNNPFDGLDKFPEMTDIPPKYLPQTQIIIPIEDGVKVPKPIKIKKSEPIQYKEKPLESWSEKRSYRGHKVLSVRVRELVFERKITTYKQVADILIDELARKGKLCLENLRKDVSFSFRAKMKRMLEEESMMLLTC